MHLLNFVSPYVLACYMFAMECSWHYKSPQHRSPFPRSLLSIHQKNKTALSTTCDHREKYGKIQSALPDDTSLSACNKESSSPYHIISVQITAMTTIWPWLTVETVRRAWMSPVTRHSSDEGVKVWNKSFKIFIYVLKSFWVASENKWIAVCGLTADRIHFLF